MDMVLGKCKFPNSFRPYFSVLYVVGTHWYGSMRQFQCFIECIKKLAKRGKLRGLTRISLFRKEFNELNNTGARMLYSINHMTIYLIS